VDKKVKKRIEVLQVRAQKLRQQLSGAKQQTDEPEEVVRLEKELAAVNSELQTLKG
jgi:hypothetical protein